MLKKHLSFANVMSCVALFLALSGAAYAATLGKNPTYDAVLALTKAALPAFGDPSTTAAQRVAEMADFFQFVQQRLPELLEEWHAQRGL